MFLLFQRSHLWPKYNSTLSSSTQWVTEYMSTRKEWALILAFHHFCGGMLSLQFSEHVFLFETEDLSLPLMRIIGLPSFYPGSNDMVQATVPAIQGAADFDCALPQLLL